jgi:hypothetical protein
VVEDFTARVSDASRPELKPGKTKVNVSFHLTVVLL